MNQELLGTVMVPCTSRERFETARQAILNQEARIGGIGTLGEKALHAIVKHYLETDPANHERKLGSFVVDILADGHIYEIQTRQFNKLNAKLAAFLPDYPVTIVYPIPARKWLLWIDRKPALCQGQRRRQQLVFFIPWQQCHPRSHAFRLPVPCHPGRHGHGHPQSWTGPDL